ncbi:response regulator [Litoribrevibacter albus]|uniref:Fused response regulator/phosphatase n=1 Tax=Litoribrevibacter albus TaxID=1473156 RepID=A0AA37W702_9GAMM|nr:response regulator [Litoribrevibacter albus]GLQ30071.1 fused response regulator/phosphatase [Litoribrevibacter albus]
MTESGKILIIDDDDAVRSSLVAYLEDSGYLVEEASDGGSGLELFTQSQPDVVLCDLRMPKMDGLTVLSEIKKSSPESPVIVVSGAGVMTDVVQALRLGASDYIVKPVVDMEILVHSIEQCLEKKQLIDQNRLYREELEAANQELRERISLLKQDQKAGRHIQQRMLPRQEYEAGDYRIQHRLFPSLYLSGDFVDYFRITEDKVLLYMADVSGHGASSAFVTVLLKNLTIRLRKSYKKHGKDDILQPALVLERINKELLETGMGKHLTIFYGVLDTKENTLVYSIGGHLPLPILKSGNHCEFLSNNGGFAVGLFEEAEYSQQELEIVADDFALITFSDGVLELLGEKSLLEKEEYLLDVVAAGADNIDGICETLKLKSIQDAPDDIAILSLTRRM